LTTSYQEFIKLPQAKPYLIGLFQNFIQTIHNKVNPIRYVEIGLATAQQLSSPAEAVEFMNQINEKVDDDKTREAFILSCMETAQFRLLNQETDSVKEAIDTCRAYLDNLPNAEPTIYSSFYRITADYHKSRAEFTKYYQNCFLYLSCINVELLTKAEATSRAHDLAISALLGEELYNFGELLMHPILQYLKDGDMDWLYQLIFTFNAGDISKFEASTPHFSSQPLLQSHAAFLRQKICLMALVEHIFQRRIDDRLVPFADIAAETRIPGAEVEHLVMKALSLGLIRGNIDEVDQVVKVEWIQPRYLDMNQLIKTKGKLLHWQTKVQKMSKLLNNLTPEILNQ
jgi:26S proteasome regulatory subunit N9